MRYYLLFNKILNQKKKKILLRRYYNSDHHDIFISTLIYSLKKNVIN